MKKLIIVIHPNMSESRINKRWVQELAKYPELYTIHELYQNYPDEQIDYHAEQLLIAQYETIIFQFPIYWFSSPPLLKKWFDEVLTHGWAYGSRSGFALAGKKIALALSVGVEEETYSEEGIYHYPMTVLTAPFQLTFEYVKADYRPLFAYYNLEHNTTDSWIEKSISPYLEFLASIQ